MATTKSSPRHWVSQWDSARSCSVPTPQFLHWVDNTSCSSSQQRKNFSQLITSGIVGFCFLPFVLVVEPRTPWMLRSTLPLSCTLALAPVVRVVPGILCKEMFAIILLGFCFAPFRSGNLRDTVNCFSCKHGTWVHSPEPNNVKKASLVAVHLSSEPSGSRGRQIPGRCWPATQASLMNSSAGLCLRKQG